MSQIRSRTTFKIPHFPLETYKNHIEENVLVNDIIKNLENNGPISLVHSSTISELIKRPIKIYDNGKLFIVIGKKFFGKIPVDAEYHSHKVRYSRKS